MKNVVDAILSIWDAIFGIVSFFLKLFKAMFGRLY